MIEILVTLAVTVSTLVTIVLLSLPVQYGTKAVAEKASKGSEVPGLPKKVMPSIQVLVLGDIGRSPRMQYHALSAAKHGAQVQLIGYLETEPLPTLRAMPNATIIPLPQSPKILQTSSKLLFLALAPVKVLLQLWNLWYVLGYRTEASQWLLVQNPPSIPTLLVASIVCFLRHTRLVIDWHNFGFSILALKLGQDHPLVRVSKQYEKYFARSAHSHFAVTNIMASLLQAEYVSTAPVMPLHDRPAALFQPLSTSERIAFLSQHALTTEHHTALVDQKMRLVVSSTSWTPDEDFSVLLGALCQYSLLATTSAPQLPELLVVITGKGPQQAHYLQRIERLKEESELEMVTIKTAWLSFEDYAKILAAADLGVSLHTSSSGVDLPMKVVDMFGAGLPVLGFDNFKAWPELVTEGVNGRGFSEAGQMSDILRELFEPGSSELENLKRGALLESKRRWDAEWDPVAGHLFGLVP